MSEVISRDDWARVAFGDVVQLSRERSADPKDDGFDRYVGLEHIEPGDLKIRRWGEIADGTTFTNVFRTGQVLFGKRRAYQRKVAVADFEGVCSGDIYVLEPKGARLLPELLPFICQTDGFFDHAVGTSAGSLSPRTNWDSLASYEFALPSREEQRRIAAAFQAAEIAQERLRRLAAEQTRVMDSLYQHAFGARRMHVDHPTGIPLGELCKIRRGASPRPIHDPKWFSDDGPGWVRIRDLTSGRLLRTTEQKLSKLGAERSVRVSPGDVILSIAATIGRPAIADADLCIHDGFVVFKDISPALTRDYLFHFLRWMGPVLESKGLLGTQKNINTMIVEALRLELPHAAIQRKAAVVMNDLCDLSQVYERRVEQIRRVSTLLLQDDAERR
jgi:type I restriction enzyme S subunit